jgi:hypothetical protein
MTVAELTDKCIANGDLRQVIVNGKRCLRCDVCHVCHVLDGHQGDCSVKERLDAAVTR